MHEWREMAAPAGTERSRPAASEPINGSAGAAAEHIHAASAGVVAAAAPTAREARRAVVVSKSLRCLEPRFCSGAARSTFALRVGWAVSRVSPALWSA